MAKAQEREPIPAVETERIDVNPPEAEPIQPGSEAAAKALDAAVSVQEQIALLAYSYWECRGCEGGSAEDDWLRAEREILSRLQSEAGTR